MEHTFTIVYIVSIVGTIVLMSLPTFTGYGTIHYDPSQGAVTDHIAASSGVHGASGSVVGTSDSQTLANKTLNAPKLSNLLLGFTPGSDPDYIIPLAYNLNTNSVVKWVNYVDQADIQFLSNKTLLSPVINSATFTTTGGTPSSLDHYEEYTAMTSWDGIWASPRNVQVWITRIGKLCTWMVTAPGTTFPNASGVITLTLTLPSRFRPVYGFNEVVSIDDSVSGDLTAILSLESSGTVTIRSKAFGNISSNSSVLVLRSYSVSYTVA